MECPFDPTQDKASPLWMNPANMLIMLAKVLAEGKLNIPSFRGEPAEGDPHAEPVSPWL